MLKKVLMAMLLILMITLPAAVTAQDVPSGKWWYNKKVVKNLNLTSNEVAQLDRLYEDSHRRLIDLKSAVKREQFELDTLLGKEPVDDARVREQFKRLEKARTDLANERLGFVIRVREIIGADRFQQLKTSYKDWR
jgi:Spy/CpxP family protein refolding chaperone